MRVEVFVGDAGKEESVGKHDFLAEPRVGDVVETESGKAEVCEVRHNIHLGKLQVYCKPLDKAKGESKATIHPPQARVSSEPQTPAKPFNG